MSDPPSLSAPPLLSAPPSVCDPPCELAFPPLPPVLASAEPPRLATKPAPAALSCPFDELAALPDYRIPSIVLVKKAYPNRRKKNKTRNWRLRSIAKEAGEEGETGNSRGVVGKMGGRDQKKVEEDYELFLRDLEEDSEMRGAVNPRSKVS